MPQPPIFTSFEIGDISIHEPVTTLTDLLVSAVCLYAAVRLHKAKHTAFYFVFMKWFFISMAIGTAISGIIGHAFLHMLSFKWKVPGWLISMISIALIERATIIRAKPLLGPRTGRILLLLNIFELVIFVGIMIYSLKFTCVETHAAYGLICIVLILESFILYKKNDPGSKYTMLAIGFCALSAFTHIASISLGKWFNHLDVSHVIMAVAAYLFFVGTQKAALHTA
jgi:hypothetical protein